MRAVMLRLSAALRDEKRFADPEVLDEELSGLRAKELCPTAGELFFVFALAWPEDAREALAVLAAPASDAEGAAARADAAAAADVNGDGVADTNDAVLILQYTAEKVASF